MIAKVRGARSLPVAVSERKGMLGCVLQSYLALWLTECSLIAAPRGRTESVGFIKGLCLSPTESACLAGRARTTECKQTDRGESESCCVGLGDSIVQSVFVGRVSTLLEAEEWWKTSAFVGGELEKRDPTVVWPERLGTGCSATS